MNAFFAAAIAAGGREKIVPAPQLQYHPDYYATWGLDPDGHDVEVVNKTGQINEAAKMAKTDPQFDDSLDHMHARSDH